MRQECCIEYQPAASPSGNRSRGSRNTIGAGRWVGRRDTPCRSCRRCTSNACRRRTSKKASRPSMRSSGSARASGKRLAEEVLCKGRSTLATRQRRILRACGIADADHHRSYTGRSRSTCKAPCTRCRSPVAWQDRGHCSFLQRRCQHFPRLRSNHPCRSSLRSLQPQSPRRPAHHKRQRGRAGRR